MPTLNPLKTKRVIPRPSDSKPATQADVVRAYKRGFDDGYSEGWRDALPTPTYAEAKAGS